MGPDDAAALLAEAGAVVGGGAAVGGVVGFIVASVSRDLRLAEMEPVRTAEVGAAYGGLAGFVLLGLRALGVH